MSDFSYRDVITGEADLHTLAAIHQKEIAPEIDNLGRRRVTKRWLRASAAQNIYLETVQIVYLEFCITHIARLLVCNVHGECMAKRMWCVNTLALRELEIIPKQLLIVGMYTVLDDETCALRRRLAAKVGNTLFGDKHTHTVFVRIDVCNHRHD